jgi:hypothetical protein
MARCSSTGPLASPVHGPVAGLVRRVAAIALVVTMVTIWLAHQLGLRLCCWLQPSWHSRAAEPSVQTTTLILRGLLAVTGDLAANLEHWTRASLSLDEADR